MEIHQSDVLGAIVVVRPTLTHSYRLKWVQQEPPKTGARKLFATDPRVFSLCKVADGKERKIGEATIDCQWNDEPTEATISTWTVPIEFSSTSSWMDHHVFLASIFEACRIVHVKGVAAGAVRTKSPLPALDEISQFTLKFDVRAEGALYEKSNSKHLRRLREWVGNTPHFYNHKTQDPHPDMGWTFRPAELAWKTNLLGFAARPAERQPTHISFAKVDGGSVDQIQKKY